MQTIKPDQLLFIENLIIKKNLSNQNLNIVQIKARSTINIAKANDYLKKDRDIYQQLIKKLIYFACKIRPDIIFIFCPTSIIQI